MILVTGSTGNVGREVVQRLAGKNIPVRALSRNQPESRKNGTVEWVKGNFNDADSLSRAMLGVDKVVLISPAHPDMVEHQTAVIDAAKAAGVKHIVKLSGLGAGADAPIQLPRLHYEIELKILASGIAHTFVRPNLFMQVLLGSAGSISTDGAIYAPAGDGAISFTDVNDIADVIVCALTQPGHEESIYEITGPAALTYEQVAETIGKALNKPVNYIAVSPEDARDSMLSSGMDKWLVTAFLELFSIYRAGYGAAALSDTIKQVTGHTANNFSAFAESHKSFFNELNEA
ncbi:MAG: SDR family oxidoreductase [Gallionellaceae bacterium]|nr:MAG: SDR family oxidoreductase [Gallionellaceae bacterium]